MRRHLKSIAAVAVVTAFLCSSLRGTSQSNPSDLFQKLQIESSTDDARNQLQALAEKDPQALKPLASLLPELISKNPYDNPRTWTNAVMLAGKLKIDSCVPALIKWIGIDDVDVAAFTLAETAKLQTNHAAKSLAMIGDPAVPAVSTVLRQGSERERVFAVYILDQIHSADAMNALKAQSQQETNPIMRRFIDRILARNSRNSREMNDE